MISETDVNYDDSLEIIELLEASAYMVAFTEDIQLQDFQEVWYNESKLHWKSYMQIIGRTGIAYALLKVVGDGKSDHISVDDLMIFINNISSPK